MMSQLADHAAQLAADLIARRRAPRNVDRHGADSERIEVAAKRASNGTCRALLVVTEPNLQLPRPGLCHLKIVYVRVVFLVAILATRIALPFTIIMLPAILVGGVAGWWLFAKSPRTDSPTAPGNPIALLPALAFVAFVAVTAVAGAWAEGRFGEQGLAILLLISGSMNVDVAIITAGGLPPDSIGANIAAMALAATIIANMAVKIGVTLAYAGRKGIATAAALGASTLVLAASIVVAWLTL